MSVISRLLPDNPVLTKELRVRMRGARSHWILFGYLGFLSLVMLLSYWSWQRLVANGVGMSEASRQGAQIFQYIVITQVFLVLFITPAITSGALTIEREQQTMDMLTMTRLPRRSIITGKLLSAVAFTALLLMSSLPLMSICFMLGSVDPGMVVSNYLMLLAGSFLIGALGLMWSSIARTTTQAVLYTYATLFFLFFFGASTMAAKGAVANGGLAAAVFGSVGMTWFGDSFLGIHGPEGIGFAVICGVAGVLMSAIAMTRLEMWPERKGTLLRGLTVLLAGVQLLAVNLLWLNGWYRRGGGGVQAIVSPPIGALILAAVFLMAMVPVFCTGDLLPGEGRKFWRYLRAGWSRKGLTRNKMHSGLPFLLLMTAFCLALYAFSFALAGHFSDFAHSRPTASNAGEFWQAGIVLFASVTGFALFCHLLSIGFGNRWLAWLVASIFLGVIFIAPELSRSSSDPGIAVNFFYFNPVQALIQMSDPFNYWAGNGSMRGPMLAYGVPMWKAVSLVWLFIGLASLGLMRPFAARLRRNTTEIPYADMVENV